VVEALSKVHIACRWGSEQVGVKVQITGTVIFIKILELQKASPFPLRSSCPDYDADLFAYKRPLKEINFSINLHTVTVTVTGNSLNTKVLTQRIHAGNKKDSLPLPLSLFPSLF
jgi:hypothetical protein